MSDMTAEQALEWLRTIAAISGAVVSDRPLSFSYQEAVKFQAAVKALTAPRVPEGWSIEPYDEGEFVIKSPAIGGQKIITCTYGDYSYGTRTLVELCRAMLTAAPAPAEQVTKVGAMEVTHDAEGRVSKVDCPMPLFQTREGEENKRLRERVKELESQLEPDMFWWADDPEHAAAYDLEGLCDQIFDNNLTPSDGIQLANVRLAASLPDAVLEAKVVERDGDFYWEARLRGGSDE